METKLIARLLAAVAVGAPVALVGQQTVVAAAPIPIPLTQVIPAPVRVQPAPAAADFLLTRNTTIRTFFDSRHVAEQFTAAVNRATGFNLAYRPGSPRPADGKTIYLREDAHDPSLGTEGYRLSIQSRLITISADYPAGVEHGMQTLLQLLPKDIDSPTVKHHQWPVAPGVITDYPRYAYRGAMLDEARHFFTVRQIENYLDELARFKVNYLHLHLSDDQGWRIQIKSWPDLTTISGGRGTGVDGEGGGFLTQRQYLDIQQYAQLRFITIVPEVDMPGHVNAAQVAYPELTCDGQAPPARTDTDVGYSSLCVSKDVTYRFAEDVIKELAAITVGPYLHIGGDEAHATSPADYVTFENKVLPLVAKYGKIAYGWHEITQSPAATSAVAQFWGTGPRDPALAASVARGTKVVMSPANQTYLDQKYDENTPLGQDWAGLIEVDTAYGWDPATRVAGVPDSAVLGIEAPLWSETLRTMNDIEYMAFPRMAALAELGWSPAATHDWTSFRDRLGQYGTRWRLQKVNFYHSPEIDWSE
jgi:hexosaminidase